ncbi:MAG: amidohydrolase, partial [Candidatus Neomarinimicrobiota bacterium]
MSILIKNTELNGKRLDVFIENNRFSKIGRDLRLSADTLIDGGHLAILPAFYNTHTHAAMSLMRSYADDIELFSWLNAYIWPLEQKITEEDVYHGARLA